MTTPTRQQRIEAEAEVYVRSHGFALSLDKSVRYEAFLEGARIADAHPIAEPVGDAEAWVFNNAPKGLPAIYFSALEDAYLAGREEA